MRRRNLEAEALQMYEKFHGTQPRRRRIVHEPELPRSLAVIGRIIEIVYEPPSYSGKGGHEYSHAWGDTGSMMLPDKPLLAVSPDGKSLYIIRDKSKFYVDERGIVG